MTEIITISYIEDDPKEIELVETIGGRIRSLGGLAILTPLRFDEDGHGGGETPTIDFPNGKILSGMSSLNQLLDSQYIEEYIQPGVDIDIQN